MRWMTMCCVDMFDLRNKTKWVHRPVEESPMKCKTTEADADKARARAPPQRQATKVVAKQQREGGGRGLLNMPNNNKIENYQICV